MSRLSYRTPRWDACIRVWPLLLLVGGCAGNTKVQTTNLEAQYGGAFQTLSVPAPAAVMAGGKSRSVEVSADDKLWRAALAVSMQHGPIVRADRQSGLIVAPPFTILVTAHGAQPNLYCTFMDALYYDSANPSHVMIEVKPEEKANYVDGVLDAIATQATVAENRAGGKWKYLPP